MASNVFKPYVFYLLQCWKTSSGILNPTSYMIYLLLLAIFIYIYLYFSFIIQFYRNIKYSYLHCAPNVMVGFKILYVLKGITYIYLT
jgi:hypothetical protein